MPTSSNGEAGYKGGASCLGVALTTLFLPNCYLSHDGEIDIDIDIEVGGIFEVVEQAEEIELEVGTVHMNHSKGFHIAIPNEKSCGGTGGLSPFPT